MDDNNRRDDGDIYKRKAAVASWAYIGIILVVATWQIFHYAKPDDWLNDTKLNSLGDFLAGVFAPIAFIWVAVAVFIQSKELELQRNELEENREVMREQAEAAKSQAEFVSLQTEAMREQIELQRQVAAASHKVALFPQRFSTYITLRNFKKQVIPHTALDVSEALETAQGMCFIYGKAFKEYQIPLVRSLNKYRNAVAIWEEYWGLQTFAVFEQMLTDINVEEDEGLKNGSQIEMYNDVKKARTKVFTEPHLHDALFLMQTYLEIDGEVGIETKLKPGVLEILRDTRAKMAELGVKPE